MKIVHVCLMLVCGLSLSAGLDAAEEENQDADWPCEQILVPEIPAAVVWAGPSIAGLEESWRNDADVNRLVMRLSDLDYDQQKADPDIAAYAAAQAPEQKDSKLTLVFAGVLETLNRERKKMLDGIKRYARGQAERANRLGEDLDEIVRLEEDDSPAAKQRLDMMQKEMEIKQRMFDERESFIRHLCTRPVVIEQKLGLLARTLAYYLD